MLSERELREMNEAKKSWFVLQHFGEFLDKAKSDKIKSITTEYRNACDEKKLMTLVAGYCALEDLEILLHRTTKKGQNIEEEIKNGS